MTMAFANASASRTAGAVTMHDSCKLGVASTAASAATRGAAFARRLAKQEECKKDLIPTPGRFLFAFGRPDVLAARQAERCAKWEWSSEFLAKARPDKAGVGNYGAGDYFDDVLTVLERNQIGDKGVVALADAGTSSTVVNRGNVRLALKMRDRAAGSLTTAVVALLVWAAPCARAPLRVHA